MNKCNYLNVKVQQKVLPIVELKHACKIKFENLWKVIEDRVDDNRCGKVECVVFMPNKKIDKSYRTKISLTYISQTGEPQLCISQWTSPGC